ncbi:MAG: PAS domain S-box protein [Candidatus Ozemobacteraceae bacterium]
MGNQQAPDQCPRKQCTLEEDLRLREARLQIMVNILQYHPQSVQDFLDHALAEVINLTDSRIGYIYHYSEAARCFTLNSWSSQVMPQCSITVPKTNYELDQTGLWGEAVRQRRSLIVNDYQGFHPLKKGCPEGHAPLYKYLTIPVFRDEKIIAVVGVANKATDYDETDVLQLSLVMDAAFKHVDLMKAEIERKASEVALRESENRFRRIAEHSPAMIFRMSLTDGRYEYVSPAALPVTGYTPDEFYANPGLIRSIIHPDFVDYLKEQWEKLLAGEETPEYEFQIIGKDSKPRWMHQQNMVVRGPDGKPAYIEGIVSDISVRKLMENDQAKAFALLRETEHYRNLIFTMSPIPIIILDGDTLLPIEVNPAAMAAYGFKAKEDYCGKTPVQVSPPFQPDGSSSAELTLRYAGECLEKGKASFEWLHQRPNGELWYAEVYLVFFQLAGKNFIQCSSIDITRRRKAENAMRETVGQLKNLGDNLPNAMLYQLVVSPDGTRKIIHISDGIKPLIGLTIEEVLSDSRILYNSVFVEDQPALKAAEDHAFQTRSPFQSETRFVLRNGEIRWFMLRSAPRASSGEDTLWDGIAVDITDHKRDHEALRASEKRYRELYERLRDGTATFDPEGRILECNSQFLTMLGYTLAEVMKLTFFQLTPPRWHAEEQKNLDQVRSRGYSELYEKEYIRKDGSVFPVELRTYLLKDDSGNITGYWAFIRDISERKRLETQLAQAQKMEYVGRLAGGVAHDFNNMLGVILGNVEIALSEVPPADPLRNTLQEIFKAAQHSADLTRQLLAFACKQAIQPIPAVLNDLVAGILSMLSRLIGEAIELLFKPAEDLWKIRIDPSQINQMLANLVVNARDAIDGKGIITITTANVRTDKTFVAEHPESLLGDYVQLSISDNGHGMDPQTILHVFEPFFTTKKLGQGTGLGLATVYGVVHQNGGFLDLQSEPGKGTTFRIYLPRFEEGKQKPGVSAKAHDIPGGAETILLVEDNPLVLKTTLAMLKSIGYTIVTAPSPEEALQLVKTYPERIDLLLTDVIMRNQNGQELAQQISSIKPGLQCLFMSGYDPDVIARQGILCEGIRFVQKPFSRSALAKAVRGALDGAKS